MKTLTATIAALTFGLAGVPALAQEMEAGERLYTQFCSACHGEMGAGAGSVAQMMTVPVPDLTHIAARNDGEFPMLDVIHIIDGRNILAAHGGPMPTWGEVFNAQTSDMGLYGSAIETRGRLMSLALYLESIQRQ